MKGRNNELIRNVPAGLMRETVYGETKKSSKRQITKNHCIHVNIREKKSRNGFRLLSKTQ